MAAPGPYRLDPVPNGSYYIFAAALGQPRDRLDYLLSETGLRGVASQSPIVVRNNQARGNVQLTLASVQLSDPPILISLPLLLAQGQAVESNGIG